MYSVLFWCNSYEEGSFCITYSNFAKFNRNFMRWFREQGWQVYYASGGEEPIEECDYSYTLPFNRFSV